MAWGSPIPTSSNPFRGYHPSGGSGRSGGAPLTGGGKTGGGGGSRGGGNLGKGNNNKGGNKGAGKGHKGNKGGGGLGFNNPIYQPSQTLSGKDLFRAANALANAQTKGPLKELAMQIGTQNRQGAAAEKLTSGYFNQLGQYVNQANQQQQQIASGLNSQLQGIGQNTQTQLQGIGQNATDSLAKYAPGTATGLSDAGLQSLASEIGRQQGIAAQDAGAFRAAGASQGANYRGLGASNLGTYSLRGQERLGNIAQATRLAEEPLNAKSAALMASKGALRGEALEKLRQQEIVNSISRQGLHIKQQAVNIAGQNAATSAKNASTSASNAAFNQSAVTPGSLAWSRIQSANGAAFNSNPNAVGSPAWGRVQSANARSGSTGSGGSKPLSTLENNAWHTKLTTVMQLIRGGTARGNLTSGNNPTKRSYDNTLVTAAYQLIGGGALSPSVAKALKRMGVNLGALGIKTSGLGGTSLLGNPF